ncbi:DUF1353 domain-containing protein [Poseidonibacter lekithochrous]|uniref:DUF1353 domain-containing protein n=1 Tax=Poseidonibacter lekithochrous TaxID=1904463 RepID=UPI000D3D9533|nr:DUF1353 domain-containing protein [Poseidonibacter lekithochrous]
MSSFTNALKVTPINDGKSWVILSEFQYEIGALGSGNLINVKENFITDFASVPWPLTILIPRWGKYGKAAVLHDWLYWNQTKTRKEADDIMLEAMDILNVEEWKKKLIYNGVRFFGFFAWNSNQNKKEFGYKKIITEFDLKNGIIKSDLILPNNKC